MENLDGVLRLADKELEAITSNGKFRSREEVDSVYKLIDIVKDIYCIWEYEDEMDGESYEGGMSYERRDRSYRGGSYNSGNSYARGRGRNARRDSMGRYASDGGSYRDGRSNRGYSRAGNDEYINHLREMMEDAPDDQTRQSIQRMIQQMENQ